MATWSIVPDTRSSMHHLFLHTDRRDYACNIEALDIDKVKQLVKEPIDEDLFIALCRAFGDIFVAFAASAR
jgi:hypothetical protein